MSTYRFAYRRPSRRHSLLVTADTPEDAAAKARASLGEENIEDAEVTDVHDDTEPTRRVYRWCGICRLPIWLTDDITSYRTYTSDSTSDVSVVHNSCLGDFK